MNFSPLEQYLENRIREAGTPGVSVCVNQGGRTVWKRAFGVRDNKGTPMETDTVFGIASMSKGLTAAALAILEAEGKLSFYDPLSRFFPTLRVPGIPQESLLLHHLATHTSGLPPLPLMAWSMAWHTKDTKWTGANRQRWRDAALTHVDTIDDIVDYISHGEYTPLGQCGEVISYSNEAFALLSSVVDSAAGEPLEAFLRRRIFEPLGMTRTLLDQDGQEAMRLGNTTGRFFQDESGFTASDVWDIAPPYRGAGWVKSTACDMARFYEMLCNGGVFRGKRIVPEGCTETLYGPRFPESPRENVYGYGLEKRPFKEHTIVEHAGGLNGISVKGGFIKGSDGWSATVFCNWEDAAVSPLINAIYSYLLGYSPDESHLYWPLFSQGPAEPERYAGRYHAGEPWSDDLLIEVRDGALNSVSVETGTATPLTFCGRTCFIVQRPGARPDSCTKLIFRLDPTGAAFQVRSGNRVLTRWTTPASV